jgi:multicomponent Na+:H+ antiporter subunit F
VSAFFAAATAVVLATVALGLVRILRGPGDADRMMAAQLLGTGGIAVLLLQGAGRELPAAVDVGLTLALLSAFASVAFARGAAAAPGDGERPPEL